MIILTWTPAQSGKSKYELPSRTWTQHLGVDHTNSVHNVSSFLLSFCVHFKFQSNEGRWKMSEWRNVDFSSWRGMRALMSLTELYLGVVVDSCTEYKERNYTLVCSQQGTSAAGASEDFSQDSTSWFWSSQFSVLRSFVSSQDCENPFSVTEQV